MKWFQVDSDTPNDPKIKAIMRHGLPVPADPAQAAAGALLLLWCYIADHGGGDPGEGVDAEGMPLRLPEMADELHFPDTQALVTWLDFLSDKRHIDPERWAANQTVVLPAMRHRADSYAKSKGRGDRREFARPGENPPLQYKTPHHKTAQDQDLFALSGDGPVIPKAEDLVDTWNLHRTQGPAVRQLTDARRTAYRKALQIEPDLTKWAALVQYIETQKWMNASGTGDHPTWRADLDFVTKPKQIGKLFDRMAADRARPSKPTSGNGRVAPAPGKFSGVDDDE